MSIVRLLSLLMFGLTSLAWSTVLAQSGLPTVYSAREIWTGGGQPIQDGVMVVSDGRVVAVGTRSDVEIPDGAQMVSLGNAAVMPGMIAAQSTLSGGETEERTLTPAIRALDGFDFFEDFDRVKQAGITTLQIAPGDQRLMPGVGGVIRLAEGSISDRTLVEKESLKIVLSEEARNPPTIYEPAVGPVSEDRPLEPTRPQLSRLSTSLAGLRLILRQAKTGEAFVVEGQPDPTVAMVAQLLQENVPLRITAKSTPEIQGAIGLAKEFEIPIILVDCVGLEPLVKTLPSWKDHVKGVVLAGKPPGRISNPEPTEWEETVEPWDFVRPLLDAGIPVAIRAPGDDHLDELMFVAGQFMAGGMSRAEVMTALTAAPAEIMGIGDQVGYLKPGAFADFVVLDGNPFELNARVRDVYLGGESVAETQPHKSSQVIRAGRIYQGNGQYLDGGNIVVTGRTIGGVGRTVSAPETAQVRDFGPQAMVVPGFIDMQTGLGVGGPLSGTITLQTKLGEQLDLQDPAVRYARQHGITTALLSSDSGSTSPVVAFKLGDDLRVISDPVAIRFKLDGNVASSLASNQRTLKAGKDYVDSWKKYEKDLAEYQVKLKEKQAKEAAAGEKKGDENKSESEKKDADKPAEPADLISGTWEGQLEAERLPPQMKVFKWELVLKGTEVTGTVDLMRSQTEISSGTYKAESRELAMTIPLRGNATEIKGTLDEEGKFSGTIELGRLGAISMTATRTVDKSKKPAEEPEKKDAPQPDDQPDKKDGESEKKREESNDKGSEQKNSESDKSEADSKAGESGSDKKEEKESELKEPEKPKFNAALEPYKLLFSGEIPALVESGNLNAIRAAAELFSRDYGVRTIIVGADDLAREPGLLEEFDVTVCSKPPFLVEIDGQPDTNLPQLLSNQRIRFGLASGGMSGSGQLPSVVQYLVSRGLSAEDGLSALSADAAAMLSEELKVGKVSPGFDADLVVLSGPPFEFSTKILGVMIDGVWVYQHDEEQ